MTLYRCYAKINLSLEVLGRRDDGYHELASVVHTISLADDLSIEAADADSSRGSRAWSRCPTKIS